MHLAYYVIYLLLFLLLVLLYTDEIHKIEKLLEKNIFIIKALYFIFRCIILFKLDYILVVTTCFFSPILYILLSSYFPDSFEGEQSKYMRYSRIEYGSAEHIAIVLISSFFLIFFLIIVCRINRADGDLRYILVDCESFFNWFNCKNYSGDRFLLQSGIFNKSINYTY